MPTMFWHGVGVEPQTRVTVKCFAKLITELKEINECGRRTTKVEPPIPYFLMSPCLDLWDITKIEDSFNK